MALSEVANSSAPEFVGRRVRVDPALYDGEARELRASARLPLGPEERARRIATILRAGVDTVDPASFGRCSGLFGSRTPEAKAGCPSTPEVTLGFGEPRADPPAGLKSSCLMIGGRIQRVIELRRSPSGSSAQVFDDQYVRSGPGWRRACRELVAYME